MIIYLCIKFQYNKPILSKDIAWKPFVLRTGRTDGTDRWTDVRTYGQWWYYMPPHWKWRGHKKSFRHWEAFLFFENMVRIVFDQTAKYLYLAKFSYKNKQQNFHHWEVVLFFFFVFLKMWNILVHFVQYIGTFHSFWSNCKVFIFSEFFLNLKKKKRLSSLGRIFFFWKCGIYCLIKFDQTAKYYT